MFFTENLLAPFSLQGDTLAWALSSTTKLQMIAIDDIGWFGARAFTDAAALNRREIDIAGDVRTMPNTADVLMKALGRPITFAQTSIDPELRVRGILGLRVADASVGPHIISGPGTNAMTHMIAGRAAKIILG